MADMTLDEVVKWLRNHVGDLRSAAQVLRESPWGAKLAATATEVDKAADEGTLAIAALEAAREDAERYRWLRKGANRGANDDVAVVRGLGSMDYGMSAVVYTYSEEIDGDDLDAAIDQARGEGGQEVGDG